MPFYLQADPDSCQLTIEGSLDIRDASALWDSLSPNLSGTHRLVVTGSAAGSLDSSILQVLYVAGRNSQAFELDSPSSEVIRSLERAALTEIFKQLQGEGHE